MTEADPSTESDDAPEPRRLSRRGLLGLAGAGAAGLVAGGAAGAGIATAVAASASSGDSTVHPFFGSHQGGIVTPVQDRLHFAAFDMADGATRGDLVSLLRDWSIAAAQMTAGRPIGATGAVDGPLTAPADDTGEALDLPASSLTLTFGFGPELFEKDGEDRFGIADRRPAALTTLPRFSGDALQPAYSGGELCVQACADDPQVAVHAIRNLSRIAFGRAVIRWSQLGFGRTSSTTSAQSTARNLFGFKDGTANIKADETADLARWVWAEDGDGTGWMAGGSYLVTRKIRMVIETWDRQQLDEQQRVIGRDKGAGAPLSGGTEFTVPDFHATAAGAPSIDPAAHVRMAHPDNLGGTRLLRRGYNYVDGNDDLGRLNAGLFFISFQRRPEQFVKVQHAIATDAMAEYIKHVGSAIFAVPPGARQGGYVGERLFA